MKKLKQTLRPIAQNWLKLSRKKWISVKTRINNSKTYKLFHLYFNHTHFSVKGQQLNKRRPPWDGLGIFFIEMLSYLLNLWLPKYLLPLHYFYLSQERIKMRGFILFLISVIFLYLAFIPPNFYCSSAKSRIHAIFYPPPFT